MRRLRGTIPRVAPRTIYEHQLPPENDPDVVALAATWIANARAAQRPGRAAAYAIPSVAIGVVIWGELNRWTGFAMPWPIMAGSAIVLGVAMGRPCLKLGALFDRRWAVLVSALGLVMAVLGDFQATTLIGASQSGMSWTEVITTVDASILGEWISGRQPVDWIVAVLAAAGAFFAARPTLDASQLLMQARITIADEDMSREEAEAAAQPRA